jgi:hypothetical protein
MKIMNSQETQFHPARNLLCKFDKKPPQKGRS